MTEEFIDLTLKDWYARLSHPKYNPKLELDEVLSKLRKMKRDGKIQTRTLMVVERGVEWGKINSVNELLDEKHMRKIRNCGVVSVRELHRALKLMGFITP